MMLLMRVITLVKRTREPCSTEFLPKMKATSRHIRTREEENSVPQIFKKSKQIRKSEPSTLSCL
uniref:Peptidyl-prolyl cis-trans isomerase n=1 Tax=Rhizophora mucronata TaxID=61149 RepID=A0A2P2K3F5_RHIMU